MKNIVAIIPARGGSKEIPRKNLYKFNDKPLIAYSIEEAIKSKYINKVVLSTEDEEIKNIALSYGAEVIDRPSVLAQDATKTAPVLEHVVQELEKQGYIADIVVTLQPTSPLRKAILIDEVVEKVLNTSCDSAFSANKVFENMPRWKITNSDIVEAQYDYHLRPRRQEVTEFCYEENGAVYAIEKKAFDSHPDMLGNKVACVETDEVQALELDTKLDLVVIETVFKNL